MLVSRWGCKHAVLFTDWGTVEMGKKGAIKSKSRNGVRIFQTANKQLNMNRRAPLINVHNSCPWPSTRLNVSDTNG